MNKINYNKMQEIIVNSQEELDMIPESFKGRIFIESDVSFSKVIVSKKYAQVVARENASVVANDNAQVEAWENAQVEAWENAQVVARENASVVANDNAQVEAWENAQVEAWGNASVVANDNAQVEARENASVVANDNAQVEARGNAQVVKRSKEVIIRISGNARIVYYPENIEDFMNFYGIKHDKKKAIFYKAVHKISSESPRQCYYVSNWNKNFEYFLGEYVQEKCDQNTEHPCSYGIHISHMDWALRWGANWGDLAILEVETKIADIVLPENSDGKVRTSKIKVIREVPLQECGVYGKILAKKKRRKYQ